MKNFLVSLPFWDKLKKEMNGRPVQVWREANAHIHTPYSFSSFSDMQSIFRKAAEEEIDVLGINDFFVTDGYDDFHKGCIDNKIFPLFNIEFIGLLPEEQKRGIRINDPNNPGRIYFCGKGLDYPFSPGFMRKRELSGLVKESQNQVKAMIEKLNILLIRIDPSLKLSYDSVRKEFAKELVRERHIAKAVRVLAERKFRTPEEQLAFLETLCGKKLKSSPENTAAIENELRSNLLKSGGAAFVEEDEKAFLELKKIIKIITDAGGIPCYPVLLDDPNGNFTEFEESPVKLYNSLNELGISCIELIPGRNDLSVLSGFVKYFNERGFIITFGTEHNAPGMTPLKVTARGTTELGDELNKIAWEGACVIAAHQYLRAHGRQGFVLPDGKNSSAIRDELATVGRMVIEYYLDNK